MKALPDRIASKLSVAETGCWQWHACRDALGYGRVWDGANTRLAHRVVYELLVGPVPVGLEIDHLCRNTSCVNPEHLEAVTHRTNIQRSGPATRRFCPRGHEYTPENTYYQTPKRSRACRLCHRDRERVRRWHGHETAQTVYELVEIDQLRLSV